MILDSFHYIHCKLETYFVLSLSNLKSLSVLGLFEKGILRRKSGLISEKSDMQLSIFNENFAVAQVLSIWSALCIACFGQDLSSTILSMCSASSRKSSANERISLSFNSIQGI